MTNNQLQESCFAAYLVPGPTSSCIKAVLIGSYFIRTKLNIFLFPNLHYLVTQACIILCLIYLILYLIIHYLVSLCSSSCIPSLSCMTAYLILYPLLSWNNLKVLKRIKNNSVRWLMHLFDKGKKIMAAQEENSPVWTQKDLSISIKLLVHVLWQVSDSFAFPMLLACSNKPSFCSGSCGDFRAKTKLYKTFLNLPWNT